MACQTTIARLWTGDGKIRVDSCFRCRENSVIAALRSAASRERSSRLMLPERGPRESAEPHMAGVGAARPAPRIVAAVPGTGRLGSLRRNGWSRFLLTKDSATSRPLGVSAMTSPFAPGHRKNWDGPAEKYCSAPADVRPVRSAPLKALRSQKLSWLLAETKRTNRPLSIRSRRIFPRDEPTAAPKSENEFAPCSNPICSQSHPTRGGYLWSVRFQSTARSNFYRSGLFPFYNSGQGPRLMSHAPPNFAAGSSQPR